MDLSKVRIGDKVYSCLKGWGEVTDIRDLYQYFAIEVIFSTKRTDCFYRDGRRDMADLHPEITEWVSGEWQPQYHLLKPHGLKTVAKCKILNAYMAEFAPDWKADWGDEMQEKYYVEIINGEYGFKYTYKVQVLGVVYMPSEISVKLKNELKNGVVKL